MQLSFIQVILAISLAIYSNAAPTPSSEESYGQNFERDLTEWDLDARDFDDSWGLEARYADDLVEVSSSFERRGNIISKPKFKCPYCGATYSTAEAAKACSVGTKTKLSCKAKF